jgi:hypothetical protein
MIMNQPVANQPPKKSGGALKWVLLGCGGIILLGIAFFGIMTYLAIKSFNTDPAKVEAAAQEILPFEKPSGFNGMFSMSMMGVKMAALGTGGSDQQGAGLVLLTMPGGKANQEQLRAQMRSNMEKQGRSQEILEKRKSESFKVRGKEVDADVEVTIHKGHDERMLQYTMVLDGPTGNPVLAVLSGPEKQADHGWVQKFLDSVK